MSTAAAPASRARGPARKCICGYPAADAADLEEHIICMARCDPEDHAEARR